MQVSVVITCVLHPLHLLAVAPSVEHLEAHLRRARRELFLEQARRVAVLLVPGDVHLLGVQADPAGAGGLRRRRDGAALVGDHGQRLPRHLSYGLRTGRAAVLRGPAVLLLELPAQRLLRLSHLLGVALRPDFGLLPGHGGHAHADPGLHGHSRAGLRRAEDGPPGLHRVGVAKKHGLLLPDLPGQHVQEAAADGLALHAEPALRHGQVIVEIVQLARDDVDDQRDQLGGVLPADVRGRRLEAVAQRAAAAQDGCLLADHLVRDPVDDLRLLHHRLLPLDAHGQHLANTRALLLVGALLNGVDDALQAHLDREAVLLRLQPLLHQLIVVQLRLSLAEVVPTRDELQQVVGLQQQVLELLLLVQSLAQGNVRGFDLVAQLLDLLPLLGLSGLEAEGFDLHLLGFVQRLVLSLRRPHIRVVGLDPVN
jgi:hypothetical protein